MPLLIAGPSDIRLNGSFFDQQSALDGRVRGVAADVAAVADDAVARNEHRDAVGAHDLAHCSGGPGTANFHGDLAIGADFTAWDSRHRLQHRPLKLSVALQVKGQALVASEPPFD